jgi:hypothetical protein
MGGDRLRSDDALGDAHAEKNPAAYRSRGRATRGHERWEMETAADVLRKLEVGEVQALRADKVG